MEANYIVRIQINERGVIAYIDGRVAFLDSSNTLFAREGEFWEIEVVRNNPSGTTSFFRLIRKTDQAEWVSTRKVHLIRFKSSKQNELIGHLNGKIGFISRWYQHTVQAGEVWEVCTTSFQPRGTTYFFIPLRKVEGSVEWFWKEGVRGNRRNKSSQIHPPLMVTQNGICHKFTGDSIEGVVTIAGYNSDTKVYGGLLTAGVSVYYWQQPSWEATISDIQAMAPQLSRGVIVDMVWLEWPDIAKAFDRVSAELAEFSLGSRPTIWKWRDGDVQHSRWSACIIVSPDGTVHRFEDKSIDNVVCVTTIDITKRGKRDVHTYTCVSHPGVKIYSWFESSARGNFWPQDSWEDAILAVQDVVPHADEDEIANLICLSWPDAADRFNGY